MKLSVIILNYNVRFFLEQCIISVQNALNEIESEIIVIDNASEDKSCYMVKQKFPEVILVENKENVGFSKANNQGVAIARGNYVCILNPDTAVAENTFTELFLHLEKISNLGALGVRLIDGTGNYLPESKRNVPTPKRALFKLLGQSKKENSYYATAVSTKGKGAVDVLVGAFMLLKRVTYLQVKGFDEDYFMYGEDIDLSYKLLQEGYKNEYYGSLPLLHYKGESTQKDMAYLNRFYGAMHIFYKKHFKSNVLLNTMVSIGVYLAKITRKVKEKKPKKVTVSPKEVLIVTDNTSLLKKVKCLFDLPITSVLQSNLTNNVRDNLLIFDADHISYSRIFSIMQSLKNNGNTFKIKPPGCHFIIGSNANDEKGEVLHL